MKIKFKAWFIILCMVLTILSGCQKQSEQIYQLYTSDTDNMLQNMDIQGKEAFETNIQEVIDETPGELTIYTPFSDQVSFYDWIITEFNKKYPYVQVTVNGQKERCSSLSDYAAKVSVDLMSGSAGDIIDVRGMPYYQYAKNNLLEDLYPYMENDPEFHKEDYYTNILEAIEYKDKLYAMPMSFFYKCVRFNKTLLEENHIDAPEGDAVNYKEIADIYHKIASNNDELVLSRYFDQLILEESENISYLDEKLDKAYFNTTEFMDFINELKRIRWPSEEKRKRLFCTMEEYADTIDENDLCLFVGSLYHLERNARLFYEHPSNLTPPIPMSASNGDKEFICPDKVLAISSSSKNKELAWKFIRFCIEEKPEKILMDRNHWQLGGYPINRNNTLRKLENAFGDEEEAVKMVDRWNSERNEESFLMRSGVLYDAIFGILKEFYGGRITTEECAKELQERAEIYLKE